MKGSQPHLDGRITEGSGREAGQSHVERLTIYLTVSSAPVARRLHNNPVSSKTNALDDNRNEICC